MKLTRRQTAFFRNFLDLYREMKGPIHYSTLAERIGVSRITAYDMLRVLEEKGFVVSDYQRAEGQSGPGRAAIVYWPTEQAQQRLEQIIQLAPNDWEVMKELVLQQLEHAATVDPHGYSVACEMLARIPPDGPPTLQYCVEVMTIIALRLRSGAGRALLLAHVDHLLPASTPPAAADLNVLAGFAAGILLNESEDDPEWSRELLAHTRQFHVIVAKMNVRTRQKLAVYLRDVLLPLRQTQNQENNPQNGSDQ